MTSTTKPKWLNEKEYPFELHLFETPVGNMHYVDEGEGDPIVFVHGNPSWSFEFRTIIKELSKTNRCIAPDHIGFGLSDKPADWSYMPKNQAENLGMFLESLNLDKITMVVGDWGGPLGLSYAINHSDKIKNIIITNTWLWSAKGDLNFEMFSKFAGGPIGGWLIDKFNFFTKVMLKSMFGNTANLTPEVQKHYSIPFENPEERKGSKVFPKQIIDSSEWLQSLWDKHEVLKDKVVLIAWGMKDIAFKKKELDRWKESFPNAKVVEYEDAGHFVCEEKPGEMISELKNILI